MIDGSNNNPFESLVESPAKKLRAGKAGERDSKGRYIAGPAPETRGKRLATLTSRQKGQPQTPYMNLSGRINWLVRMLSQLTVAAYIAELRRHPAREEIAKRDLLQLEKLETRALAIAQAATELAAEIAQFNRSKNKRKL
jgi:hypothetical protein